MRPDSGARHGQAETGPIGFARKKRLKNVIGDATRDPGALVTHREFEGATRVLAADFDTLAGRRDVDRVVDADDERGDQLIGFAQGEGGGDVTSINQRDGSLLCPRRGGLQACLHEFAGRYGLLL